MFRVTLRNIVIMFSLWLLTAQVSFAQADYKSEAELKKKAEDYFSKQDYVSAMPLYSQLLSLSPKDPKYNYRFGVCIMFADRRDTEKPIRYLDIAAKNGGVDISVYYYLGMAYHINYRFKEAIDQYQQYKAKAGSKADRTFNVDRQIEMCNNGMRLLSAATDLFVLENTDVNEKDFTRSYNLSTFGGKLLMKPEELKTKIDRKKKDKSLVFLPDESKVVYFSSYGTDGRNGRDIYKASKDKDGKWIKPVSIGSPVNTAADEDFPYLLPDGKTLYFASKGHNSMGGYDIFKSTLSENGIWSDPENLDYPINTPFDDILFVSDSLQQYAYFSSNRVSIEGQINVYRVRIDKRPKIDTKVELELASLYDRDREDSSYLKTIEKIKDMSKLDVNANEKMFVDTVHNNATANNNGNNATNNAVSNNANDKKYDSPDDATPHDMTKIAQTHVANSKKAVTDLTVKKNAAKIVSDKRKQAAKQKNAESTKAFANADKMTDLKKSQDEINRAKQLKEDADALDNEAKIADDMAAQMDKDIVTKQKEADHAADLANDIINGANTRPKETTKSLLKNMVDELKTADTVNTTSPEFTVDKKKQEIAAKQSQAKQSFDNAKSLQEDAIKSTNDANNFRDQASKTSDAGVKQNFLDQAAESDNISRQKNAEADAALSKGNTLNFEVDFLKSQNDLADRVVKDINETKTTDLAINYNSGNNNNNGNKTNNNTTNNNNVANNTTNGNKTNNNAANNNNTAANNTNNSNNGNKTNNNTANNTNNTTNGNKTNINAANNNNATSNNNANNTNKANNNATNNNNAVANNNNGNHTNNGNNTSNSNSNKTNNNNATNNNNNASASNPKTEKERIELASANQQQKIKNDIEELNNKINSLLLVASNNTDLAKAKSKEADQSYENAAQIEDADKKQKEIDKADKLKAESDDYAKRSIVAYNLYRQFGSEYKDKEKDLVTADKLSTEITDLLKTNNETDAKKKLYELENIAVSRSTIEELNKEANTVFTYIANDKNNSGERFTALAVTYNTTADSLNAQANRVKQKADETKNKSKKQDLMNQYKDLKQQSENFRQHADQNDAIADQLKKESSSFKTQIDMSNSVLGELNSIPKNNIAAASVNKNELEKNIIDFKNKDILPGFLASDTISENNRSLVAASSGNFSGSGNNNPDTNLVMNNNQPEKISDFQKESLKVQTLKNTVNSINDEVVAIEKRLLDVTDPAEKLAMQENIADLKQKAAALNKQADDINANAQKIKKTESNVNNLIITGIDEKTVADKLEKEANQMKEKAAALRTEAAGTKKSKEKKAKLTEADQLEQSANTKLADAQEVRTIDRQNDYYANRVKIENMLASLLSQSGKVQDASNEKVKTAQLLLDDAKSDFEKAMKEREGVNDKTPPNVKQQNLAHAVELEDNAIAKQKNAMDIYKKINDEKALADNVNKTNNNGNVTDNTNPDNTNKTNNNNNAVNNNNPDNTNNTNNSNGNKTNNNNTANNTNNGNKTNNNTTVNNGNNNNNNAVNNTNGNNTNNNNAVNNTNNNTTNNNTNVASGDVMYTVQVGAGNSMQRQYFDKVVDLKVIRNNTDGITRYISGKYSTPDDAFLQRKRLIFLGYTDAFVRTITAGDQLDLNPQTGIIRPEK